MTIWWWIELIVKVAWLAIVMFGIAKRLWDFWKEGK